LEAADWRDTEDYWQARSDEEREAGEALYDSLWNEHRRNAASLHRLTPERSMPAWLDAAIRHFSAEGTRCWKVSFWAGEVLAKRRTPHFWDDIFPAR